MRKKIVPAILDYGDPTLHVRKATILKPTRPGVPCVERCTSETFFSDHKDGDTVRIDNIKLKWWSGPLLL